MKVFAELVHSYKYTLEEKLTPKILRLIGNEKASTNKHIQ